MLNLKIKDYHVVNSVNNINNVNNINTSITRIRNYLELPSASIDARVVCEENTKLSFLIEMKNYKLCYIVEEPSKTKKDKANKRELHAFVRCRFYTV